MQIVLLGASTSSGDTGLNLTKKHTQSLANTFGLRLICKDSSHETFASIKNSQNKKDDIDKGFILNDFPNKLSEAVELDDLLEEINKPLRSVLWFDNEANLDNLEPLLNYYDDKNLLCRVNGVGNIEDITNAAQAELELIEEKRETI